MTESAALAEAIAPEAPSTTQSAHPRAGKMMTGAEIIVQVLADETVDVVFGYSGGAILPTYDAIFRFNNNSEDEELPLVVPANEQGAGFMAAGYARASGKVGVALVTSGPGATNVVTPVADCNADSIPMVVICGQVPTAAMGTDAFQEAPISNIMAPCAKHVFLVTDPSKLEQTMRTAFEVARTGRPGPVVVDVPKDVQNWQGEFKGEGQLAIPGYRNRLLEVANNELKNSQCAELFLQLAKAKRPLIYAGGGVINANAADDLCAFAETFEIPVVTTLMGIGSYDTTKPQALHMLGMHGTAYANYAVEDCDLLLAVGARFDDRVAGRPDIFAPDAKYVAHLDIDPSEIHKVKSADWHHVGNLNKALQALITYGQEKAFSKDYSDWHAHCLDLQRVYKLNYDKETDLIQPYYVIEEINKLTDGNAIITTGVGQHQMWAAQYFDFRHPRQWLTSGSMGTMGFGLPAAIGAQYAAPDKIVIDIDGDASIRMNIGEMETVTTYDLPVKIVVLNNCGDGMVRQWQKLFFDNRFSATDKSLHKKDFILAAKADGFPFAKRLDNKADVPTVIKEFIEFDGPAFLEVMIDPNAGVYPMVGPGMGYKDMITGDWIESREAPKADKLDTSEMF